MADDGLSQLLKLVLLLAFLPAALVTLGVGGCLGVTMGGSDFVLLTVGVLALAAVVRAFGHRLEDKDK